MNLKVLVAMVTDLCTYYAPNFEEAYCFQVVRASVRACMRPSRFLMQAIFYEPCMLGF